VVIAAVCGPTPASPTSCLAVFKLPPLAQVALGIPAAFPKPFNVVPPDKNKSPSVKTADVGGGKFHSSVVVTGAEPSYPPALSASVAEPEPFE